MHAPELFAAALRYARDRRDAEDLVQETLLRAFAAWERFEAGTNCRAWLYRILVNSFISECRRISRDRRWATIDEPVIANERQNATLDPERLLLEATLADEVVAALAGLPEDFRRVVVLADLEGLSYREVALHIGCPVGTVMSRLHRARRLLEEQLGSYAREQGIRKAA